MKAPVLHSELLDTLGREITSGAISAHDVLTLSELEERFSVSRTVVREVMRILEILGMVSARRRVGLVVQPLENWAVLDRRVIGWRLDGPARNSQLQSLTQLRVALEPPAARLAAEFGRHAGPELIDLAEELEALGAQGLGNSEEYLEVDIRFHTLIIEAGGNELFTALSAPIAEVLTGRSRLGLTPVYPDAASVEQHKAIAWAIAEGRPNVAERSAHSMLEVIWDEIVSHPED